VAGATILCCAVNALYPAMSATRNYAMNASTALIVKTAARSVRFVINAGENAHVHVTCIFVIVAVKVVPTATSTDVKIVHIDVWNVTRSSVMNVSTMTTQN
jgi:hypothetical protein